MQHTEEATAKAEAERIGCLRLVKQRRVVERQLAKGVAEVFVIIGVHRKNAGINLRLYALEAGQRRRILLRGRDQGVAHRRALDVFDACDHKTHLARHQASGFRPSWSEHTNQISLMLLAG